MSPATDPPGDVVIKDPSMCRRRVLGDDHPYTLNGHDLANAYRMVGRYDEAAALSNQ